MTWPVVGLGEVVDISSSLVDPTVEPYASLPHVGSDNIESSTGRLVGVRSARELGLFSGKFPFGPDDVLYSKIRPALNKVAIVDAPGICSADIYPLRPRLERVDRSFLCWQLRSSEFLAHAARYSSRTSIPKLNRESLFAYRFRLPCLHEQLRIADILDRADAMRAKRREALALLNVLSQSLFEEMFGRDGDCRWPVRPVSAWVQTFETGKSVDPAEDGTPTRNRVLKVSAVTSLKFLPDESKPVPDEYAPPASHFVRAGDLLFSRANTRELIGATALVHDVPDNLLLPDKLWRFVWRVPSRVDALFVQALFRTPAVRQTIGQRASGTSGSMKNISQEKVLEIETILPPLELQREFARRVDAINKLTATHRASLAEMDALFASLQHRAFRGEL